MAMADRNNSTSARVRRHTRRRTLRRSFSAWPQDLNFNVCLDAVGRDDDGLSLDMKLLLARSELQRSLKTWTQEVHFDTLPVEGNQFMHRKRA